MEKVIENWFIAINQENPYIAPELCPKFIKGNIYNHEIVEDGTFIKTDVLEKVDLESKTATTKKDIYHLGKVEENYSNFLKEYEPIAYEKFVEVTLH